MFALSIESTMWTVCGALLFAYFMIDVHYYLRVAAIFISGQYFRRKLHFTDSSTVYGIVLPSDADFMFTHMNNARYLREYDFGRFDHATRTGIIAEVLKSGRECGGFFVAASTIRYRQPVMMFSTYKVLTRPMWWDEKYIYYDHRMVTLADGITRSVGYSKSCLRFDVEEFVSKNHTGICKPPMPDDMCKWVEYNNASSERMKQYLVESELSKSKQS